MQVTPISSLFQRLATRQAMLPFTPTLLSYHRCLPRCKFCWDIHPAPIIATGRLSARGRPDGKYRAVVPSCRARPRQRTQQISARRPQETGFLKCLTALTYTSGQHNHGGTTGSSCWREGGEPAGGGPRGQKTRSSGRRKVRPSEPRNGTLDPT